mgnify:CR=1 FL=1
MRSGSPSASLGVRPGCAGGLFTSTNWRNAIKFNVFSLNEVEMEDSE